jgi:hypothetical protein
MKKIIVKIAAITIVSSLWVLSGHAFSAEAILKAGMNTIKISDRHESVNSKTIPVDIYIPSAKKINGTILVLPGWNFSRERWHKETGLLKYADKMGFQAVFPEMGISCYESEYFPETTRKWSFLPGGKWIREILIPELRKKYGILKSGNKNFLLGLSTGGRGVLLVSLQNQGLFTAGGTLSGDTNQFLMPKDRLMAGQYGPYEKFKDRWLTVDNPEEAAKKGKWEMPLYIGHGKADKVTPFDQSKSLYNTLKKKYPDLKITFNEPENEGHDFNYWGSEVKPVLEFFNSFCH